MAHPSARNPLPSNSSQQWLAQSAACFERVAASITERRPDAELMQALKETCTQCAAATHTSDEIEELRLRLKTAVETWQSVWARLGTQQEFRLAVAREAQLWARRLRALGEGTTTSSQPR